VNIRIILKSCQRKSKRLSLTVVPTRAVEHRAMPANILQSALVDFAGKECVLSQGGVPFEMR